MSIRFDYYITGDVGQYPVGDFAGSNFAPGQTFLASTDYDIESVKLRLTNPAIGTGTLTIGIYAVDGSGFPINSALAEITFDLSTMSLGETWYEFTFQSSASLTNATTYCIVLETSDNTENVAWDKGTGGIYTDGKTVRSIDSGAWGNAGTDYDLIFETWGIPPLPGKPTNPSPGDTVSSITLDESPLSWDASSPSADTYEIYFREQGDAWGDPIGTAQAGVSLVLDFGSIDYSITYEWRVDATNAAGTTTGDTWSFDAIVFAPILPGASGGAGGGGGGGGSGEESSPSGENNMITLRRLVAAANSKIWYEDV